jgi:hypothetical protein
MAAHDPILRRYSVLVVELLRVVADRRKAREVRLRASICGSLARISGVAFAASAFWSGVVICA